MARWQNKFCFALRARPGLIWRTFRFRRVFGARMYLGGALPGGLFLTTPRRSEASMLCTLLTCAPPLCHGCPTRNISRQMLPRSFLHRLSTTLHSLLLVTAAFSRRCVPARSLRHNKPTFALQARRPLAILVHPQAGNTDVTFVHSRNNRRKWQTDKERL